MHILLWCWKSHVDVAGDHTQTCICIWFFTELSPEHRKAFLNFCFGALSSDAHGCCVHSPWVSLLSVLAGPCGAREWIQAFYIQNVLVWLMVSSTWETFKKSIYAHSCTDVVAYIEYWRQKYSRHSFSWRILSPMVIVFFLIHREVKETRSWYHL